MDKLEKLEKTLAKGKWHFILWRGVLGWGVPTAILFNLITHYLGEKSFTDGLLISLIIFPIVGILFGTFMWILTNKSIQKLKSE